MQQIDAGVDAWRQTVGNKSGRTRAMPTAMLRPTQGSPPPAETPASTLALVKQGLGQLAARATGSYLKTTCMMIAVTLMAALTSVLVVGSTSWLYAVAVAVSALVIGTVCGFALAFKRALVSAIVFGLEKLTLGCRLTRLVFDRLVAIDEAATHGERGSNLVQKAERVPLGVAEARLRSVVDTLVNDPGDQGGLGAWLAKAIRRALLEQIERVTLTRLRQEGQKHGGVNFVTLRDEVGGLIDATLIEHFEGSAAPLTALAIAATFVAPVAAAVALVALS